MKLKLYNQFRHWLNGGVIWVYSDPHFGDSDCELMDKNWPSPEFQVHNINSCVGKKDTLVILGDIGDETWIPKIKGHKILVLGNHDKGVSRYEKYDSSFTLINPGMFDEVYDGPLFINDKILLSHEPIELKFGINIHGHCHSGKYMEGDDRYWTRFNVCSNIIGFTPIRLDNLVGSTTCKGIHRLTIDEASTKKGSEELHVPNVGDNVNHPSHYNSGKYEPIDIIEDWKLGFNLGNTVKYISRCEHKGKKLEDLKKAEWYLSREIGNLEKK